MAKVDINEIVMALTIKWILVEWANGTFDVVNVKSVQGIGKPHELTTGKDVAVLKKNGIRRLAKVVMSSDDRQFLFQQKVYMNKTKMENQVAGPSKVSQPRNNTKSRHSVSWDANSWSTEASSEEIPEEKPRRSGRRRTTSGPKSVEELKLSTSESSTNSVEVMAQTNSVDVGTSTDLIITYDQKSQTDCTTEIDWNARLTISLRTAQRAYLMSVVDKYGPSIMSDLDINNDAELDNMFNIVNERVNEMKSLQVYFPPTPLINDDQRNEQKESKSQKDARSNNCKRKLNSDQHSNSNKKIKVSCSKQARSPSTHSNNMPICEPSTSKRRSAATKKIPIARCSNSASPDSPNIMVPLGSGHTMIRRSKFDQINWSSHTMATRQLLSAVFSRSVLATHSLTGKRSPAFQHLPPKSCLDQRKVTDLIMTVTKMCQVKENLVRAAITVKCADENKMMRQKEKRKTSNLANLNQSWDSDQENQPIN